MSPAPAPSISKVIATVTLTTHSHQQKYRSISRADATLSAPGSRKGLMLGGARAGDWSLEMAPDILSLVTPPGPGDCDARMEIFHL